MALASFENSRRMLLSEENKWQERLIVIILYKVQRTLHFSACSYRTRLWTLSWTMKSWYTVDTGFLHRKPEEWYSCRLGWKRSCLVTACG